jgi:hypothetical protein
VRALILASLPSFVLLASPAAASMRCGAVLVGPGKTALELSTACGPPGHIARRTVVTPGLTPGTRTVEEVETWTYPGDAQVFTRVVELRRGRVASISTAGYGLDPARCTILRGTLGTTIGELELTCGAPAQRSQWVEEHAGPRGQVRRVVQHERWVVNPGAGQLLRVLEFADGRLVGVETGGRAP